MTTTPSAASPSPVPPSEPHMPAPPQRPARRWLRRLGWGVAAVAASSLLGLRNGFYGLQVARILEVRGWRRAVAAQQAQPQHERHGRQWQKD